MDKVEQFFDTIRKDMTVALATAAGDSVTMRVVSPVYMQGGILIFTCCKSQKYRQLRANPNCCVAAGAFFATCTATFLGATMRDENEALRAAYSAKFPGAFDEGIPFGGREAEFILLKPTKLSGWAFDENMSADVPTVPFEIALA